MNGKSTERKSKKLGMPFGTATGRLRKMILFKLLKKLNENFCFKCGKEILLEELSIEHKIPWENNSVDLFWDLDNIAFSHMKCNVPSQYAGAPRKIGPSGTVWCGIHKDFAPETEFDKCSTHWSGFSKSCKKCKWKTDKRNKNRIPYSSFGSVSVLPSKQVSRNGMM